MLCLTSAVSVVTYSFSARPKGRSCCCRSPTRGPVLLACTKEKNHMAQESSLQHLISYSINENSSRCYFCSCTVLVTEATGNAFFSFTSLIKNLVIFIFYPSNIAYRLGNYQFISVPVCGHMFCAFIKRSISRHKAPTVRLKSPYLLY